MKNISLLHANAILLFLVLTVIVFYYGQPLLVPFSYGVLLAMLLLPVCNWLERKGLNRLPAVFISILIILLFIALLFAIISAQITNFANELPQVKERLIQGLDTAQQWIFDQFEITPEKQIVIIKQMITNALQTVNTRLRGLIGGVAGGLASFVIVLIYIFFLLWKREKYESFVLKLTDRENHPQVKDTLYKITKVASEYLGGRLISMGLLAGFYIIGFSIIGLKNAVLLGLIAVIPTIIPYVGPLIGAFFPLAMSITSGDSGVLLPVVIILVVAQAIDNYFIEPFVLGSYLSLSPFITIVSIIIGELLWGVSGMILFIPLFAIIKIICDHIPALHPYGYLLGEEKDGKPGNFDKIKSWFQKKSNKVRA